MNRKVLKEIIRKEYSKKILENNILDISRYYSGRRPWYDHLKPLTDPRNKLYKWEELFNKVGINPTTIFAVGDEMINNRRNVIWFKCDKKNVNPIEFVDRLRETNNKYFSKGDWRLVENGNGFFILEYDADM